MSLLAGADVAQNAEVETDRLGGFQLLDTDAYQMVVETAYLHNGKTGSRNIVVNLKSEAGDLRTMQCFMSGTDKGSKTYYEKDGKQFNLPGFTHVNDLIKHILGTDKDIGTVALEDKVIKIYNAEAKGEINTPVKMLVDLLKQPIGVCVQRQTVDKTALGGDNKYHPTGEVRDENDVVKFFSATTGLTMAEVAAGATVPDFVPKWKEKNAGKTWVKAKGNGGVAGAPAGAASAPVKLFS